MHWRKRGKNVVFDLFSTCSQSIHIFLSRLWYYYLVRTQQNKILPLFSFYLIALHRQLPVGGKPIFRTMCAAHTK